MKFRNKLLLTIIAFNVIATTTIFIIVKVNAYNAVSKIANDNARNLLKMAMVSIENQYTSFIFHKEYSFQLRKTERQNILALAKSSIHKYYTKFKNGKLSESAAKKMALQSINDFRYDNGDGYIWINDTLKPIPRILVHPIYPEYNDKISTAPIFFSSSDSSNIPRLAVDLCEKQNSGFIKYFWSKPNNPKPTGKIPKISYVELYEPWQWILGTGVYLEDLESDAQKRMDAIIKELKKTIGNINIAKTGYFYIFNSKREILLHPLLYNNSEDSVKQSVKDKIPFNGIIQAEKTQSKTYNYVWNKPSENESDYLFRKKVFIEYFKPLDWYVCASIYEDELELPSKILGRKILYLSIIFLAVSIIITIRLSLSIAKPLMFLMKSVSEISAEKEINVITIPVTGSMETKQLGRVIKGMLNSIDEQKNHLVKAKLKAEENEQKLRANEIKYRTLFESSNDAIFLIKGNKIIDYNHNTLKLFDCTKESITGSTPSQLSPEYQPDGQKSEIKEQQILSEVLQGNPRIFEWKHTKQNGEHFDALVSLSYVELDSESFVQAVVRDITERKKTEKEIENHKNNLEQLVNDRTKDLKATNEELTAVNEELYAKNEIVLRQKEELEITISQLKEAQSKLIQSEKMASLGVLTAGIAHEINNPLNFILGGSTGLENVLRQYELDKDTRIKTILNSLKTGAERITKIVKGLNQFSREKDVYDEDCNIHLIIDNCLTILYNQFKYRIEIQKKYLEDLAIIKGNVGKLHQVFLNVIQNAVHAIEDEGTISIKTYFDKNNLLVEVSDTGTGISEENMPKIIDPFFTTKEPGKGTGLGLSITYSIVKEHNGEIEFISEEGYGTMVKLTFSLLN